MLTVDAAPKAISGTVRQPQCKPIGMFRGHGRYDGWTLSLSLHKQTGDRPSKRGFRIYYSHDPLRNANARSYLCSCCSEPHRASARGDNSRQNGGVGVGPRGRECREAKAGREAAFAGRENASDSAASSNHWRLTMFRLKITRREISMGLQRKSLSERLNTNPAANPATAGTSHEETVSGMELHSLPHHQKIGNLLCPVVEHQA
ncbi:hypothetical protein B0H11DRAFT_1903803 [Mycena galericulata]|nr:hypothetical protein B0H11DRAFT_1903803 [Mycena galericulata]